MNPELLDELLRLADQARPQPLPPSFARDTTERALRAGAKRRALRAFQAGSMLILAAAVSVCWTFAHLSPPSDSPPALTLFQTPGAGPVLPVR